MNEDPRLKYERELREFLVGLGTRFTDESGMSISGIDCHFLLLRSPGATYRTYVLDEVRIEVD